MFRETVRKLSYLSAFNNRDKNKSDSRSQTPVIREEASESHGQPEETKPSRNKKVPKEDFEENNNNNDNDNNQQLAERRQQWVDWRKRQLQKKASIIMFEEWPQLEFADLNTTVLDLFPSETASSVTSSIVADLSDSIGSNAPRGIKLTTDEQLRWCMQALNHALTLSFEDGDFAAVKSAVRVYLHWLGALSDLPDRTIPSPLLDSPEKYFRNMIDSLRSVFIRRGEEVWHKQGRHSTADYGRGLAIERQAAQIELVLDAIRQLAINSARMYQDEVWTRVLSFLLNSSDLLLSEPSAPEELGIRAGRHMIDVLFDLWFRAVCNEQIPSLSYWRTLSMLCKRWRHNTIVIESWACKLLSMTVLVCKKMYGDDYLRIEITDESMQDFLRIPYQEEEGEVHLLYQSWYNLLHLFGSPADFLTHEPRENKPLNGDRRLSSMSSDYRSTAVSLPTSFFLAVRALQKMVDLFYGDNRVDVECRETRELLMKARNSGNPAEDLSFAKSSEVFSPDEGTITSAHRSSFHSNLSSGKDSRNLSESNAHKRSVKTRISDRSNGKSDLSSQPSPSQATYSTNESAYDSSRYNGHGRNHTTEGSTSTFASGDPSEVTAPSAPPRAHKMSTAASAATKSYHSSSPAQTQNVAAHNVAAAILGMRAAYSPLVGERRPKSERLLQLLMDWLTDAAVAGPPHNFKSQVTDDVISGLSLASVDLDDCPEVILSPMSSQGVAPTASSHHAPSSTGGHAHQLPKRSSIGSSSSSQAGDSSSLDHIGSPYPSSSQALSPTACDGISAGRAAALSALLRIVCSKNSNEKLSSQQLAAFYATLYQALIEKNRVVLCALFYYGRNLFRLGLPGVEVLLPHYLFGLDIVLIESSKLRLHPSISEVEMRRACLRTLSSVICWPTTFGMSKIPQFADSTSLKSSAATYLHLRARIYKTLVFSLRNETDPINLHLTLSMCTILMEESCSFDLGLNDEQTKEMIQIVSTSNGSAAPEKGLCVSFVRGFVSAVCDRLARPEWTSEHSVSLAAIDLLNALARVHPTVLFNNKDVSTGSLIVASLCRFIETQLMKPPPLHSKDLHSTVVAAYVSISVWLNAAPILAECEGVLQTVAEAVQLGVTGSKKPDVNTDGTKAASKRVYEAAEYLMYSLFCLVGRPLSYLNDELRLQHSFGTSLIDSSKFVHFLVNGDTLLSLHEASHIPALSNGCPAVIYVRRSPIGGPSVGVAILRPYPVGYQPDSPHLASSLSMASSAPLPSTPQSLQGVRSAVGSNDDSQSTLTTLSTSTSTTAHTHSIAPSAISETTLPSLPGSLSLFSQTSTAQLSQSSVQEESRNVTSPLSSSDVQPTPVGSIISGMPKLEVSDSAPPSLPPTTSTALPLSTSVTHLPAHSHLSTPSTLAYHSVASAPAALDAQSRPASSKPPPPPTPPLGKNFVIPPDFHKQACKLDSIIRDMTDLRPTETTNRIMKELDEGRLETDSVWRRLSLDERGVTPPEPVKTCDSIRIFLYDFGLLDEQNYGTSLKYLDSSNSDQFYADLHDTVDSCPSRAIQTAHIFYVKEGQRSPIDILDNALNIQNTSADFCAFLNGLGEGITIGVHDTWTGHWSTAFANERKPVAESEGVDHYLLDGVTHALWHAEGDTEIAFLMPTERSMRIFRQNILHPAISARRGSSNASKSNASSLGVGEDRRSSDALSMDSAMSGESARGGGLGRNAVDSPAAVAAGVERDVPPYSGGGSSMGSGAPPSRRSSELRLLLVWLEKTEDMKNFPIDELLATCDEGAERHHAQAPHSSSPLSTGGTAVRDGGRPAHLALFFCLLEPGLVMVRSSGSANRFGESLPLVDGVVVSQSCLAAFVRLTLLNISRRNVAEIENFHFNHTKRKLALNELAARHKSPLPFEQFLATKLLVKR